MSTPESKSANYVLLNQLADEFAERYRRGERPALEEYIDRQPELADDIREFFPAMLVMEQVNEARAEVSEPSAAGPLPALERLGDFRIIREIGHGGMGVVYEAEQVSLGRHVALKVLPRQVLADAKTKRRFEREAKAAARLHHTNIVPVFGVGEHDGLPYYVMQFIPGLGLDEVLEELQRLQPGKPASGTIPGLGAGELRVSRNDVSAAPGAPGRSLMTGLAPAAEKADDAPAAWSDETVDHAPSPLPLSLAGERDRGQRKTPVAGRLSDTFSVSSSSVVLPGTGRHSGKKQLTYWQSVAQIGVQVADALEYAHRQGIQHRDIKPSNLLLDTTGTVWVTDFGLAKADDQETLTHTGDVLGTLRYMPPEAFDGRTDARGDVYSLGLTLYELLAFRPAFEEKERKRLIKKVTTEEPARLDRLNRAVPRDLVTIVHKAIERDLAHRYPTAGELEADLKRFLDDEPIQARRQTQVERLVRWARRNPGIAVLGGVLTAVLVLVTVASLLAAGHFNRLRLNEAQAAQNERDARAAESAQRQRAELEKQRADDNAKKADDEARLARRAEQEAKDRATAEAAANALAQREKQRAEAEKQRAEEQLTRAEWLVYAGKLSLAQTDFETGNGGLALRYLDECQWNLRGWEHRYLWTRINAGLTLLGHKGAVWSVAFSPDGKHLVSGGQDGTVKVWDAATGQELLTLKGHTSPVRSVAFSPDGNRIATGAGDPNKPAEAKVWDAGTGQELLALKRFTGEVWSVAFSPDGKRIVTGDGHRAGGRGEATVWDAGTGQEILALKGHTGPVRSVAFSPDNQRIVSGGGDGAKVWDAETGQELRALKGYTAYVWSVAFSPDNKRIVTGCWDRTAKVWDAATGQELLTLKGHTGWVLSAAFSPDNKRVVTGSVDNTVRMWDAETGLEVLALKGHAAEVSSVAFSPDGKRIVSASADSTAKAWDAETGQKVLTLKGNTGPVRGVAFSPHSKRLVAASGVWDAATGQEVLALKGAGGPVAFSPDGKRIVTGSQDKTANVWDAATGQELLALKGHTGEVLSVAFSPDGKRIATAAYHQNQPGAVRVWDAETGEEVLALDGLRARVWSVAFSPDGKRILTGDDRTAKLWDAATGQELLDLKGHTHEVWSVAFSLDGKRIVTGCLDRMVRVWNAETGQQVLTLKGHTEGVWNVAFSPNGKRIVSGSDDNTVRLWDAGKGQELLALKAGGVVFSVAFSPDGKRLASGSEDGTVKVWVAEKGQPPRNNAELMELLKDRLPALLREEDRPADNAERLALAQFAFDHKEFVFATRLWAEALASDPKLGDDRQAQHRYNAARAAVLAAAGQAKDEPPPDDAAKAKLRRQALDWLKAELAARGKLVESGPPQEREGMVLTLTGWKYDADLAGIRDAAALARLPADEQKAFTQLWVDVAALLKTGNAKHGAFLQERLPQARKTLPKDSPELAYLLAQIGRAFLEQENWTEAESLLRECLAIREKVVPDSWTTFNTCSSLGGSLLGQKKYAEAEPLLLKGCLGMKERKEMIPPVGKDRLPEAVERLVQLYEATGKKDEAAKWHTELLSLRQSAKPEKKP